MRQADARRAGRLLLNMKCVFRVHPSQESAPWAPLVAPRLRQMDAVSRPISSIAVASLMPSVLSPQASAQWAPLACSECTESLPDSHARCVTARGCGDYLETARTSRCPMAKRQELLAIETARHPGLAMLLQESAQWAPLAFSECLEWMPDAYAPCVLARAGVQTNLEAAEELVYKDFALREPSFLNDHQKRLWRVRSWICGNEMSCVS